MASHEDTLITIPTQIVDSLSEDADVNVAFAIFTDAALFPVRRDATTETPDSNNTNTTVASQVVSASVAGVTSGARLSAPVRISLRLIKAPVPGTDESIIGRRCVFWDYSAAGKHVG